MSNEVLLGISCGFHDSSAALVGIDGKQLFASSEERFTRIKGDKSFPTQSIEYCLRLADSYAFNVKTICLHENIFNRIYSKNIMTPLVALKSLYKTLKASNTHLDQVHLVANRLGLNANDDVYFSSHHHSHAYAAYSAGDGNDGMVIVNDAIGERSSGLVAEIVNGKLLNTTLTPVNRSLGLMYSLITVYCGFKVLTGEYKLMGLAPYGDPVYFEELCSLFGEPDRNDSPNLGELDIYSDELFYKPLTDKLKFLPRPTNSKAPIHQRFADLASSMQKYLEISTITLIESQLNRSTVSPCNTLYLGGGVALNCKLNYIIATTFKSQFNNIYAYPASGDAGSSIGACINYIANACSKTISSRLPSVMLGVDSTDISQSKSADLLIRRPNINDQRSLEYVIQSLQKGRVGAVFEGRSEFGPRALGNRSIIADPRNPKALEFINSNIKNREDFRPLAPVVLESDASDIFEMQPNSSQLYKYMLTLALSKNYLPVNDKKNKNNESLVKYITDDLYPAIVHQDGTARIQIVSENDNTIISSLLTAYKLECQCPILINTSFNVRGEPIVNSKEEAINCFINSSLDFIIFDDSLVVREDQNPLSLIKDTTTFALD
ncbi:carbamoyltransferase C-terminal domain-containing protein [Synechococcus sp. A15-60]|uniref:carbamoyltransferase C-terminal domain-containing protein n=1 Tax=Synechococcus sp. A15-60 TaxID=1050655 RepID=UPI001647DAA2|nr:carbamoyltransferase C-terminal domain-containing protein [Synechococcus sp. A15-60]QNI46801.1 carbamoyltransferase family protein [Synechococcus sp. A15-60]